MTEHLSEVVPAEPRADSILETFRSIGYSLEVAVADIVDNSISAGARNVGISFNWAGSNSWVSITDDGLGMNGAALVEAMRPGSSNPLAERSPGDLGRFGLGLKTASFSQCRRLTVISRRPDQQPEHLCWDLDHVRLTGRWELTRRLDRTTLLQQCRDLTSGTIILWEDLDRLAAGFQTGNQKDHARFLQLTEGVQRHLAMVFHRFLPARAGTSGRVRISINDRQLYAWDPFLLGVDGSQPFAEEQYQNGKVTVRGYVLPHKSRLTETQFQNARGPRGWNAQQGFYIYRNERLLVAGDWLGLFRKEEHYKLARIQVDIPNYLDADWQIDIKKSVARPPFGCLMQLQTYAKAVRSRAVEVYRHKGRLLISKPGEDFHEIWRERYRHEKRHYEINRDHPLVKTFTDSHPDAKSDLNQLLRFIEETIPVSLIMIRESETPEQQASPFEAISHEPVKIMMRQVYENLTAQGRTPDQARSMIANIQPFNLYPQYLAILTD